MYRKLIADRLPKAVVYWSMVRAGAYVSSQPEFKERTPESLGFLEVLEAWADELKREKGLEPKPQFRKPIGTDDDAYIPGITLDRRKKPIHEQDTVPE